jgi:hypothetical protein
MVFPVPSWARQDVTCVLGSQTYPFVSPNFPLPNLITSLISVLTVGWWYSEFRNAVIRARMGWIRYANPIPTYICRAPMGNRNHNSPSSDHRDTHHLRPNQSPTTPGNPNQVFLQVLLRDDGIPFVHNQTLHWEMAMV